MIAAQSSLIFNGQDGKMLSCKRWFVSVMVLNFNVAIVFTFALGIFGCLNIPNETQAMESPAKTQISTEIDLQNEMINWLEAKSAKYARYKISYPKDGIIHAKGTAPVGNATVRVNILEVSKKINQNLDIKPQTASYNLNSRVKIRTIASKTNAIAAVNGGYFKPQTGVPLGVLMIDNELLTGPIYERVALGINSDNTYSMGKSNLSFALKNKKTEIKIDNVNQPRMLSTYALLYTDKWGKISPPPPKYGLNVLIQNGRTVGIYSNPVEIPKGAYVVSAPEKIAKELQNQKNLTFEINYPKHFENSTHIISGGPYLVKDGEIYIDTKEERLTAITGKNPRTMVGYTKNDDLIIVTVDGRENYSLGMSLYEAAKFMQSLGCINAMNLDGGSSSVMYLNGKITNTPPMEGGIPISGALTVGLNETVSNSNENEYKL